MTTTAPRRRSGGGEQQRRLVVSAGVLIACAALLLALTTSPGRGGGGGGDINVVMPPAHLTEGNAGGPTAVGGPPSTGSPPAFPSTPPYPQHTDDDDEQRPPLVASSPDSSFLQPSTAAQGNTLRLSTDALAAARQVQRPTRTGGCPRDRFLFVNTHTFGRHHNQLQEVLNLAVWARTFNRTVVLGWFRHDHRWTPMRELYDFAAVQRDYCLVEYETFRQQWAALPPSQRVAVCAGQAVSDTPLKRDVRRCGAPTIGASPFPPYFDVRRGVELTGEMVRKLLRDPAASRAALLGLGGQMAFFLRPGLLEQAAVVSRVAPSKDVVDEAARYTVSQSLKASLSSSPACPSRGQAAGTPQGYFGVHLRQREAECMKEVNYTFADGGAFVSAMSFADRQRIAGQCALTVEAFDKLVGELLVHLAGSGVGTPVVGTSAAQVDARVSFDRLRLFLASDRQNRNLERDLLERRRAVMYGGKFVTTRAGQADLGALRGLGVDFTLLACGERFTGNQLSSVTQNVCFHRLGHGGSCDGFVAPFTLFHSRNAAPEVFRANVLFRQQST